MSKRIKENNWVDLSSLPRMGGESTKIYWTKCYDLEVPFSYEGIKDVIKIIKPLPNRKLLIIYNKKEMEVSNDSIKECKLSYIVGLKTHDFKYCVGEVIEYSNGKLEVLNTYHKEKYKKHKYYTVKCLICGGIYNIAEEKIEHIKYCSYCCGKKLLVGFNDMWTTNFKQASWLLNPEDGYKYMQSSSKVELDWKCPVCGEILRKSPNDVHERGLCCPKCKNITSYPNRFMYHFIRQLTDNVTREKLFDWSEGRKYDIYFDDKYICEAHGIQHYEETGFTTKTLKEEQENDRFKEENALKNGIKEYIIIDCRYSDFDYIKQNTLNSRFSVLYDLSKIDWIKLENDINNNILLQVSKLWNSGIYDPKILAQYVNINPKKINIILNRASKLGLCDYDTTITQAIGREKVRKIKYHKYAKPILCNENGDCYGNVTLCVSTLKEQGIITSNGNIQRNIKTNKFPIYGLTFQYISHKQFNNIKSQFPDRAYGDFFDLSLDETEK